MRRYINQLNFRTKIILICLVISLIPTFVLGGYCYIQLQSTLSEKEHTTLRNTITLEVLDITTQLSTYNAISTYIVWNEDLLNMLSQTYETNSQMSLAYNQTVVPILATLKSLFPEMHDIMIYTDLDIYPAKGTLEPLSCLEQHSWYEDVFSASGKSIHFESDKIMLTKRFLDIPRNIFAIIKVDVESDQLFSRLTQLFDSSYGIQVVDSDGHLLWHYYTPDIAKSCPQMSLSSSDQPQEELIVESATDSLTGWTFHLYRPAKIVLHPTRGIIYAILIMIAISFCLVFVSSFWISHALINPLRKLIANMRIVSDGNYTVTLTPQSTDEIGQLIQIFIELVQKLNTLINETLKAKIIQQKLELRALQSQINPHFLYNTLSLINSQSILSGHPEIGVPARYMATFYRTSLNKGQEQISVKDEIENIKAYINIQLLMHDNSFDVHYDIDEGIFMYIMPNLMLQPLVENAILHGIDHLRGLRRGQLTITARAKEDIITFTISDNGPGIPDETFKTLLTKHSKGYGVENVHTRAQLQYGTDYGLHYETTKDCGTTVTLSIPKCLPLSDA